MTILTRISAMTASPLSVTATAAYEHSACGCLHRSMPGYGASGTLSVRLGCDRHAQVVPTMDVR